MPACRTDRHTDVRQTDKHHTPRYAYRVASRGDKLQRGLLKPNTMFFEACGTICRLYAYGTGLTAQKQ